MPLFSCWKDEAGTFAIWKTEESNEALRASLKGAFPYDADLSRLKAESRRSEYLAVRVLLAEVCGEEKEICHEPSGSLFWRMEVSVCPSPIPGTTWRWRFIRKGKWA